MSATDGPESNVIQLHIYDLTRGLAAELSPVFLGKIPFQLFACLPGIPAMTLL